MLFPCYAEKDALSRCSGLMICFVANAGYKVTFVFDTFLEVLLLAFIYNSLLKGPSFFKVMHNMLPVFLKSIK